MTRAALMIGLVGGALLLGTARAEEDKHFRLRGTRVSMVKPRLFVRGEYGTAFVFPNGPARIQVTEIARPLAQVREPYSEEAIRQTGALLREWKEVEIGGHPGLYLHASPKPGSPAFPRWIAVFGNDEATVIIDATGRPESEEALDRIYRKSILGARWNPDLEFSPYEALPFVLVGSSLFEFASRYQATLTFTKDGKLTRDSPDDPILVVTTVPNRVPEAEQAEFCTKNIQLSPVLEEIELVATGEVSVDGVEGCEALARAKDKETARPMMSYEANLFEAGRYYNFTGIAGVRFRAEYVTEFARMVRRLRRK
jgi:hypothetical protein